SLWSIFCATLAATVLTGVFTWRSSPRRRLLVHLNRRFAGPSGQRFAGPRKLRVGTDGIEQTSRDSRVFFRWSAITRIEKKGEVILFRVGEAQELWVPRRAFADEDCYQQFASIADALYRAAGGRIPSRC